MAKLCDIVKPGVPAKVKRSGTIFTWTGRELQTDSKIVCRISEGVLFAEDYELVPCPTVESVFLERGYSIIEGSAAVIIDMVPPGYPFMVIAKDKRPATPAQATAIADLLDGFK